MNCNKGKSFEGASLVTAIVSGYVGTVIDTRVENMISMFSGGFLHWIGEGGCQLLCISQPNLRGLHRGKRGPALHRGNLPRNWLLCQDCGQRS